MKRILSIVVLFAFLVCPVWAIDETTTGFYYPTGVVTGSTNWMASGCNGAGGYFENEYHIGSDISATLGSPVYPISDGIVEYISYNGWENSNVGVFIKHRLSDGSYFLALYGHIQTTVSVGDTVFARVPFATIGSWSSGDHLHFGVVPGSNIPPAPFGRMNCSNWPATNSFVDPINWITTQMPFPNIGHYVDGWHIDGTSQAIVDRFKQANPGGKKLGWPFDNGGTAYVHDWYGVTIQDFWGPNTGFYHGFTALILNPSGTAAHLLKEGFWNVYVNPNFPGGQYGPQALGALISEEYVFNGYTRQDCQYGYMTFDDAGNKKVKAYDSQGTLLYEEPGSFYAAAHQSIGVTIASSPTGADIWNNLGQVGTTPLTLHYSTGDQDTLTAKKVGYQDETFSFTVGGVDTAINIVLQSTGTPSAPTITSPSAGGQYLQGNTLPIRWSYSNGYSGTSDVYVFHDGQLWLYGVGISGGAFDWVIPQSVTSTQTAYVRVGPDAFTYTDSDVFTIGQFNQPPVAQSFADSTSYPDTLLIGLSSRITDNDGSIDWNTLTVTSVSNGTATPNPASQGINFAPSLEYFGPAEVRYTVQDNDGAVSNEGIVSIDIYVVTSDLVNGDFETQDLTGWSVDATVPSDVQIRNKSVRYSRTGQSHWSYVLDVKSPYESLRGFTDPETTIVFQEGLHFTSGSHVIEFDAMTGARITSIDFEIYSPVLDSVLYSWPSYVVYERLFFRHFTLSFTLNKEAVETEFRMDFQASRITGRYYFDDMVIDPGLSKQGMPQTEPIATLPQVFALHQNYPNPFNPSTQIRFDLPEATDVKLDIFNVLGQKIRTLVDRQLPAGQHFVMWHGQDELGRQASSGIYIYKLQSNSFVDIKKMMFLK